MPQQHAEIATREITSPRSGSERPSMAVADLASARAFHRWVNRRWPDRAPGA